MQLNSTALSRLGPYEIIGLLGTGGMGTVHRAKDPRLNREVALKVLTETGAVDATRQARLLQEARAASALSHPNIITVYDVGVENGIAFVVSELVDGPSLREEMLRHAPLGIREFLDLAVQMADGLTAAHEAGIIHRDLKPENVMLTRSGRVKLVDFGVARMRAGDTMVGSGASLQATRTDATLLVGTVPYMSPEQGRGDTIDYRSDQFALGLIFYQLATGKHPFERDTPVQTLSAIIADDPPSIAELNPKYPPPVRWIIERCLAKEPRERYAATADLAHDLRWLQGRLAETTTGTAAIATARTQRWLTGRTALGLLGAFAIGLLIVFAARAFVSPETSDLSAYRFTPLASEPGYQGAPAWSPDGKTIAYMAEVDGLTQIFTRGVGSSMRAQVTHTKFDCRDPFWSPDGTRIFYISLARDREAVWSVSVAGGSPELVVENAGSATISPDGKTLAFLRQVLAQGSLQKELWYSSPVGAPPRKYEPRLGEVGYAEGGLHFSPDGSKLGVLAWFWIRPSAPVEQSREFWIVPWPSGNPHQVRIGSSHHRTGVSQFSWLADNRHIVSADIDDRTPGTHLWLVDTQSPSDWPITVGSGNENFPAVSPSGAQIAFTTERADFDLQQVKLDGSPASTLLSTSRNEMDPAWSPVSAQYTFVTDRTGRQQIWLRSADGTWERPLVTDNDFGQESAMLFDSPSFSPDGQRIAYHRLGREAGGRETNKIWISTLAGSPPVRLTSPSSLEGREEAPTWSPDAAWIAFAYGIDGRWVLAKSRVGSEAKPVPIKDGVLPSSRPRWAPTGNWIGYDSPEGLSVISPDGKTDRVLSEQLWLAFDWAEDGDKLFGIRPSDDGRHLVLAAVDIKTGEERIIAPNLGPMPLASQPIRGFSRISSTSFATSIVHVSSDIWLLEGFRTPTTFFDRVWPKRPGAAFRVFP